MATTTTDTSVENAASDSAAALDQTPQANIPAATAFSTSGAPVQLVPDVDPSHPAVDNDPRRNTTVLQNRIDFNDPSKTGADVVAETLGMKTPADADKAKPKA